MKYFFALLLLVSTAGHADAPKDIRKINLQYFSDILPNPKNRVNFTGYFELIGTKLMIFSYPSQLFATNSPGIPILRGVLDLELLDGSDHVYSISSVVKEDGSFSQSIIFEVNGVLDLSADVTYLSPDGEVREIRRAPDFPPPCVGMMEDPSSKSE